ncbi:MAG: hypothetical protein ABUL72_00180 [Armatimonadota bacterium]
MTPKLESAIGILREIADICDHVSLTGALRDGREAVLARYNQTLKHLADNGVIDEALFNSLPPEASFDQIGVEARMLRAAVKQHRGPEASGDFDIGTITALAPFSRGEDIAKLIHKYIDSGRPVPAHMLTGLAPFLRSEDLGLLMERAMAPQAPPAPPKAPEPPAGSQLLERTERVEIVDDEAVMHDKSLSPEARLAAAERLIRLHSQHLDLD